MSGSATPTVSGDWPVPLPADIAERYYAGFESAFAFDADGQPTQVDPRTPNSAMDVLSRVAAEAMFDLYLFQANEARELMPDTAQLWLSRHCDDWGVPRLAATSAGGLITVTAPALYSGLVIPEGVAWTLGGVTYLNPDETILEPGATASVLVTATSTGTAGNLAAGSTLTLVSAVAGVTLSVVGSDGLTGGEPQETPEAWRTRLLARIRAKTYGGRAADYVQWATDAGAAYVNVVSGWVGPGSVGIVVAMAGPAAPSAQQLATIQAAIDAQRPVTVEDCVVVPAALTPVPVTVSLNPDTVAGRAAATAGAAAYFATPSEVAIAGTLRESRLEAAISSASGAYSIELISPAADETFGRTQLPVLGPITWAAAG